MRCTISLFTMFAVAVVFAGCRGGDGASAGRWTPENGPLLFTATHEGVTSLYFRSDTSGQPVRLSDEEATDNWGVWSPDRSRIAFQSQRDGSYDVFVMEADGSGAVNLTDDPAHDGLPVWSPDGAQIAFFSSRGFEYPPRSPIPGHIYVMGADGSGLRRITQEPLSSTLGPSSWSPDGNTLLLSRAVDQGTDIFALDVTSGSERRLTSDPTSEGGALFSPDGNRIALYAESVERSDIVIVRPDGSDRRVVTSWPGRYYPHSWSPDGEWIAATWVDDGGGIEMRAVRADGSAQITLSPTGSREREPAWR